MTSWILWGSLILVFHTMESESDRLVVNTTCLELSKSSNQPLRLTCPPDYYHCLLDESYTKEFEVCREWKWIPGGKCAYFNSYGNGNVDERMCQQQANLTCSPGGKQFSSADNTKYTACYVKKATTPAVPTTTSSSQVTETFDRENTTSSPGKSDKAFHVGMKVLASVLGSLISILSFCVIYFVIKHSKNHCKECALEDLESCHRKRSVSKDAQTPEGHADSPEKEPLMPNENMYTLPSKTGNAEEKKTLTGILDGEKIAQGDDLKMKVNKSVENTSDHSDKSGTIPQEKESVKESEERDNNKTDTEGTETCIDDKGSQVNSVVDVNKGVENTSENSEQMKNVHQDKESVKKSEEKKDTDADNTSTSEEEQEFEDVPSSPLISPSTIRKGSIECPESDNASDAESTGVFDDTVESLQTGVRTTDKKEMELCQELYNLLHNEGRELTQGVLRLVIIRSVGKTPEELIADETTKEDLKAILPEESHSFLSTQRENVTSINVLYGLIQVTPGIEPKSGWGEPVKGSDTGIGDDVERLYRIFYICMGISDHKAISVDNYVRLVNIMLTAVTRLDCDGELKDRYKVLADKLKTIKNPNWSQSMFRMFNGFVKRWSPL